MKIRPFGRGRITPRCHLSLYPFTENIRSGQEELPLVPRAYPTLPALPLRVSVKAILHQLEKIRQSPVIDLVGLVTPEIVPLKRARQPLAPFLCMNKADYIVIYPGTHDDLFVLDMELVWLERVEMNTINPGPTLHIYRVLGCSRVR